MKNTVKMTTSILILMFAFVSMSFCQDKVQINRTKRLSFNNESKAASVKIVSSDEYNYLKLKLHCYMNVGSVKVEIIDPNGDKKGSFTVKVDDDIEVGENTFADNKADGKMDKAFKEPINGEWFIKVTPLNAKGNLSIFIIQGFEPKIDLIGIGHIK